MKKRILKTFLTCSFFSGLFMVFGTAGYSDFADMEDVYVTTQALIFRYLAGVCLMLPLVLYFKLGGKNLGNNDNL